MIGSRTEREADEHAAACPSDDLHDRGKSSHLGPFYDDV